MSGLRKSILDQPTQLMQVSSHCSCNYGFFLIAFPINIIEH